MSPGERVRLLSMLMAAVSREASPREIGAACLMLLASLEMAMAEVEGGRLADIRASTDAGLKAARDGVDDLITAGKN